MMADINFALTFILDVELLEEDFKEFSVTTAYYPQSFTFKPPRPWNDLKQEEQEQY